MKMTHEEKDADPLSLLRQYNIDKKQIVQKDGEILLGKYYWPKNVETSFFKKHAGKGGISKEYYTLECLVNFLRNADLPHPEYVKQAEAKGIPPVRRPDRKDLLKYLSGKTDSSANIDTCGPLIPPGVKRDLDSEIISDNVAKKMRVEEREVRIEQLDATDKAQSEECEQNVNGKTVLSQSADNSAPSENLVKADLN